MQIKGIRAFKYTHVYYIPVSCFVQACMTPIRSRFSFLYRYLAITLYLTVISATMTPTPSRALSPTAVNFSHFGKSGLLLLMLLTLVEETRGERNSQAGGWKGREGKGKIERRERMGGGGGGGVKERNDGGTEGKTVEGRWVEGWRGRREWGKWVRIGTIRNDRAWLAKWNVR